MTIEVTKKTNNDENAALRAQLDEMRAKVAKMEASAADDLDIKVAKSGGASVYGVQNFPITMTRARWKRLLAIKKRMLQFFEDNEETWDEQAESAQVAYDLKEAEKAKEGKKAKPIDDDDE